MATPANPLPVATLFPTPTHPGRVGAAPPSESPARRRGTGPGRAELAFCVLGTGSGGNCSVVCLRGEGDAQPLTVLIDLGFGPRTTARRLAQLGIGLDEVDAVLLTHLDQDHFRRTWPRTLIELGLPLWLHRWHAPELDRFRPSPGRNPDADTPEPAGAALRRAGLVYPFDEGCAFTLTPRGDRADPLSQRIALRVGPLRQRHDQQGTVAYRLDAAGSGFAHRHAPSMGYATDLGHVPRPLIEHFAGVDLLAIEANYDERMTIHSPRPSFVNRRNLSDRGHLSNEQALAAAAAIADAAWWTRNPRHVVLMHRSSQCNHPTKVRRVFQRDPWLSQRAYQAQQRQRSRWFRVKAAASGRSPSRISPPLPWQCPA